MQVLFKPGLIRAAFLLVATSVAASASTISFVGNLRTDATVTACGTGCALGPQDSDGDYAQYAAVLRDFVVGTPSIVKALTFSYGGGVNGSRTTIAPSGFEPYLSLFDATGKFLSSTFFGTTCPAGARVNATLGGCYDVLLNAGTLAPGAYRIAISAYENLSLAENYGSGTLVDGFTGLGNLYPGENLNYAFDVSLTSPVGTPPADTPEPASGLLAGLGAMLLFAFKQHLISRRNL